MKTYFDIIITFFPNLSQEIIEKLKYFCNLVTEKNSHVNLISRKDIERIVEAHLLPSLAIYKLHEFPSNSTVLDIGSGGGFPGIPLAITMPNVNFTLIDSIQKKITATKEFTKTLSLQNVICINDRAENLNKTYNYIVGRAVANIDDFQNLAKPLLKKNGKILYLTGGNITPKKNMEIFDLFTEYQEKFCETKKLVAIKL